MTGHRKWRERSITSLAMWLWKYIEIACREILVTDSLSGYRPSPFVTGSFSHYRLSLDEIQELRMWLKTMEWSDGECEQIYQPSPGVLSHTCLVSTLERVPMRREGSMGS